MEVCNDILFDKEDLCSESGGVWFGPIGSAPALYDTCCDVREAVNPELTIVPTLTWAVRNQRYKLVKAQRASCDADMSEFEFYDLLPTADNVVGLDLMDNDLFGLPLTQEQMDNLDELQQVLQAILDSEPVCYGDGNLDKVVNQLDFVGTHIFSGQPSVFDMNEDGTTDAWDTDCVLSNFGNVCTPFNSGAPCPTPAQHRHAATNGRR